ncbi:MAG: site-specific DNA-methyltransferase [Mycobacterium sp.]
MAPERLRALYQGDNLTILRRHVADASVDLVYADPPFNSNRDYATFVDTWRWTAETERACTELVDALPARLAQTVTAFQTLLGPGAAMAYLVTLLPRLIELHRVLKPTGSLYLHCDPTMSHYVKILLDAVFAEDRGGFLNEIVWSYRTGGTSKRWFSRKHDTLLLYVKDTAAHTFNPGKEKSYLSHKYGFKNVEIHQEPAPDSRHYTLVGLRDVWTIDAIRGNQPEALGYPTQKPLTLLERVITASSNPGDVVLDPFCGCGTTLLAADQLDRSWIGIDIGHTAIELTQQRLGCPLS